MRSFCLFLFYTFLGSSYALLFMYQATLADVNNREAIVDHTVSVWRECTLLVVPLSSTSTSSFPFSSSSSSSSSLLSMNNMLCLMTYTWRWVLLAPTWLAAVAVTAVACAGGGVIGMVSLMARQLWIFSYEGGSGYVDILKLISNGSDEMAMRMRRNGSSSSGMRRRVLRVVMTIMGRLKEMFSDDNDGNGVGKWKSIVWNVLVPPMPLIRRGGGGGGGGGVYGIYGMKDGRTE